MTRVIDTPKALLVEVPEGSYWFELDTPVKNRIVYALEEKDDLTIDLPTGYAYDQPMLAGDMTAKDWKRVVEDVEVAGGNYGKHYGYVNYDEDRGHDFNSALESGLSLLRSHNMKPETTVVIPKKKLMEKNLYVSITSGEETFYFTKENALLLLSKEFDRVEESENDQHEFAYEWDWHWLTQEEYIELTRNQDTPTFPTEAVEEGDEMWQKLILKVEQHQKRQTEYPDVINELKSQYKLIKK